MNRYICVDIGGTAIKYGVINENQKFLFTSESTTPAKEGGKKIIEKVIYLIKPLISKYGAKGICISSAGMVDPQKGKIVYASELIPKYKGLCIKDIIEKSLGLACEIENDVKCAALAEFYKGASKNTNTSICLTIGTGIGAGIILDGKLLHGFLQSAGEIGYMNFFPGQFQDLAATSVLVKKVSNIKKDENIDGKYIFDNAKKGDVDCIQAIDEMTDILGRGLANICYFLNPEIIILGGGIMAQKDYLKEKIEKSLKKYLIPYIAQKTKIAFAKNQNKAGMLGAYFNFKIRQEGNRNIS